MGGPPDNGAWRNRKQHVRMTLHDFPGDRVFNTTLNNLTQEDSGKYSCEMKENSLEDTHLSERTLIVKSCMFVCTYVHYIFLVYFWVFCLFI